MCFINAFCWLMIILCYHIYIHNFNNDKKYILEIVFYSAYHNYPHKTSIVWIYVTIIFPVIELNQQGLNSFNLLLNNNHRQNTSYIHIQV